MDPRNRDRDLRDRDMRMGDPRNEVRDLRDRDLRDPRLFGSGSSAGNMPPSTTSASVPAPAPLDPRAARRGTGGSGSSGTGFSASERASSDLLTANKAAMSAFSGMAGLGPGATDKEKANLIMQVLQLSDEQISVLPAEQRQSILALKEQVAIANKTSGR